uniref:Uncharacterized protein n=1 Tax=Oryza nivara TaxID=4536 RepID=A0A0E0IBZ9_ORYNI
MLMPPLPVVRLPLPPSAAHAAPTAQWPRALRHRGGGGIEARGDGRGRGRRGVVCAMAAGEAGPGPGPAPSRTQMIMDKISSGEEVGGAGGAYSYNALKRLDQIWSSICEAQSDSKVPEVVTRVQGPLVDYDLGDGSEIFDVLVCGGTLGIFVATALSYKGLRVGIIERNIIKGREQEWNISRKELMELVEVGILSEEEIEQIISSDFNPTRCAFESKGEIWVENILNLGISPAKLVEIMKERFVSSGGAIFEGKSLSSISVHDDFAVLNLSDGGSLPCRLVIDAMGNFSPIVRQGFPAGSGPTDRTTYMFTYVDPHSGGPKLEELLETFWDLMPAYEDVVLENLDIMRVIFGIFPTYRNRHAISLLRKPVGCTHFSPLTSNALHCFALQVGDASGIQSPVSFGGFGSLTRHLGRLSNGIYEAVSGDLLDARSLQLLNPYMVRPNLSASWLFQRAMSARPQIDVSPTFINELLFANFESMQDVIQFGPLVKTLGLVMITRPQILPSIFKQAGPGVILNWSGHFVMLGYYTFLSTFIDPILRPWVESLPLRNKYQWKRYLEAWKYGAGLDYRQGE